MKFVSTADHYRQLVVERDDDGNATKTVSETPLEVSNEEADRIVKLGESVGIAIVVTTDVSEEVAAASLTQPTPDLSTGVSAITGTGEPVTNDGDTTTTEEATPTKATTSRKQKGSN